MQKKSSSKSRHHHFSPKLGLLFLALFGAAISCYLVANIWESANYETLLGTTPFYNPAAYIADDGVSSDLLVNFKSEGDFKNYLIESGSPQAVENFGASIAISQDSSATQATQNLETNAAASVFDAKDDWFFPDGQASGDVNLPDIAQSDGSSLFFSSDNQYYPGLKSKSEEKTTFLERQKTAGKTNIYSVTEPQNPKKIAQVDGHGKILLANNILAVFLANQILGYDVSDPGNPALSWKIRLDDNSRIIDSRKRGGVLYLTLATDIDFANPCPARPILDGDNPLIIKCQDIYHPLQAAPVDTLFSVMTLDADTGRAVATFSFVGSARATNFNFSPNYLYVAWGLAGDPAKFISSFIQSAANDLVPDYVSQKIARLAAYDLSGGTKTAEIDSILGGWTQSQPAVSSSALAGEFARRLAQYSAAHGRDLDRTMIVKIGLADFKYAAGGEIPGHLLDSLSINEYNGDLRVGVAVGSVKGSQFIQPAAVVNDVYILGGDLRVIGSALDLGLGRQINAARFFGGIGYLATSREADPFYLLDMSDDTAPKLASRLDLPGKATYLHQISATKLLAISNDNSKTKLSLYDVSLASDPKLLDKYNLDEYWTDAEDSLKAFFLDSEFKIFFTGAGKNGYIFSYAEDKLTLKKNLGAVAAERVLGDGRYIYFAGNSRITVVDESTLEKVARLDVK